MADPVPEKPPVQISSEEFLALVKKHGVKFTSTPELRQQPGFNELTALLATMAMENQIPSCEIDYKSKEEI